MLKSAQGKDFQENNRQVYNHIYPWTCILCYNYLVVDVKIQVIYRILQVHYLKCFWEIVFPCFYPEIFAVNTGNGCTWTFQVIKLVSQYFFPNYFSWVLLFHKSVNVSLILLLNERIRCYSGPLHMSVTLRNFKIFWSKTVILYLYIYCCTVKEIYEIWIILKI